MKFENLKKEHLAAPLFRPLAVCSVWEKIFRE